MILQLRIYIKQNSAGNLYLNLTTNFIRTFILRSSVLLLCTNHAISLSKSMPMHAHAQVWTKQHIWYSIIIWSKIDAWSGEKMVKPKMSNWDRGTTTGEQKPIVMAGSIRPWHEQRRSSGLAAPSPCPSYSSSRASPHQAWRPHQPGSPMATTCARSRILAAQGNRWPEAVQ